MDDVFDLYGTWTNYTVNGKPYFFGELESGD